MGTKDYDHIHPYTSIQADENINALVIHTTKNRKGGGGGEKRKPRNLIDSPMAWPPAAPLTPLAEPEEAASHQQKTTVGAVEAAASHHPRKAVEAAAPSRLEAAEMEPGRRWEEASVAWEQHGGR
jgi:hypothetical protein